jgi:hypothetical protein
MAVTVAVAVLLAVIALALLAITGRRTFPWESIRQAAYLLAIAAFMTALVLSAI